MRKPKKEKTTSTIFPDEENVLRILTNRSIHEWTWKCVAEVVARGLPSSQADAAFLMETMSDLAKQHQPNNEKSYFIDLPPNKSSAVWRCMGICLEEKFFKPPYIQGLIAGGMQQFAEVLDLFLKHNPEGISEVPKEKPKQRTKLTLVNGSEINLEV